MTNDPSDLVIVNIPRATQRKIAEEAIRQKISQQQLVAEAIEYYIASIDKPCMVTAHDRRRAGR